MLYFCFDEPFKTGF